ncbi:MAG: IS1182 family transposase [bacterium]
MSRTNPSRNQIRLIDRLIENRIKNKPHAARFFLYIANTVYFPFYEVKDQGTPPYDRPTLVALILYGLYKGRILSDSIIALAKENLGGIYILGKLSIPSYKTVERVIDDILDNIDLFFHQVLELCIKFDLVGGNKAFIDGTKTKANASKHKAMSYDYLNKKIDSTKEQIKESLEEITDYFSGFENLSDEDFFELLKSESIRLHQKYWQIHQQKLNERQKAIFSGQELEKIGAVSDTVEEHLNIFELIDENTDDEIIETMDIAGLKAERLETMEQKKEQLEKNWQKENGNKKIPDKTQINFTDPQSAIMVTKHHGVQQCYNNFGLVDAKAHVILGTHTTNISNDKQSYIPTILEVMNNLGSIDNMIIGADAGFFSATNIKYSQDNDIDFYVSIPESKSPYGKDKFVYDEENDQYTCPEGEILTPGKRISDHDKTRCYKTEACKNCPVQSECTKAKDGIRKIRRNLKEDKLREKAKEKAFSPKGREILKERKSVPEPVWGNLKQQDGLDQLHYRGLDKASKEFKLRCVMHNLRKLLKVFINNTEARNQIIAMGATPTANVA